MTVLLCGAVQCACFVSSNTVQVTLWAGLPSWPVFCYVVLYGMTVLLCGAVRCDCFVMWSCTV